MHCSKDLENNCFIFESSPCFVIKIVGFFIDFEYTWPMYRKYKSLVKQHPSIKKSEEDKDKADICQSAEENQPKEDKTKVPRQLVTFYKIFN